ncbi:major capsid protein [Gokushovirinae sp.]|nr:major capsid protein [Gokushovirinae sp.]
MDRNYESRFAGNPTGVNISRSIISRDHSVKFSFNVGDVVPFMCDDILPGDTVTIDTSKVVRLQPMVAPIMDEVFLDTYYFFVPYRLLWNHWINFMGENTASAWEPEVEYSVPQVEIPTGGYDAGTIADYMGVPIKVGAGQKVSAMPFRAYALICDQWFRSENLMTPVNVNKDDSDIVGSNGADQVTDIVKGGKPFIACKTFDYFTAALPEPQKGPDVKLPLGTVAPLTGMAPVVPGDDHNLNDNPFKAMRWSYSEDNLNVSVPPDKAQNIYSSANNGTAKAYQASVSGTTGYVAPANLYASLNGLNADLSMATASTVNELRQAFAIQKYYERLARGGSRYIEMIKAFYGVTSPDARLQRAEYLGGNRIYLDVEQVAQQSSTKDQPTPAGSVFGLSVTGDTNSDFTKSFTEHGLLIGVCVARYHHTYQQGIERMWFRKNLFDFYNPTFANLGEVPILKKEIYFTDNAAQNDSVFGYQEAWADYRYKPNRVAGEMRSAYSTPLDSWHLADNYSTVPSLSADWIREDKTMLDRALAVTSQVSNQLIADFYIKADYARPMPVYSIPGLIDHN